MFDFSWKHKIPHWFETKLLNVRFDVFYTNTFSVQFKCIKVSNLSYKITLNEPNKFHYYPNSNMRYIYVKLLDEITLLFQIYDTFGLNCVEIDCNDTEILLHEWHWQFNLYVCTFASTAAVAACDQIISFGFFSLTFVNINNSAWTFLIHAGCVSHRSEQYYANSHTNRCIIWLTVVNLNSIQCFTFHTNLTLLL